MKIFFSQKLFKMTCLLNKKLYTFDYNRIEYEKIINVFKNNFYLNNNFGKTILNTKKL